MSKLWWSLEQVEVTMYICVCLFEDLYPGNSWKKVDICPAAHNLPDSSRSPMRGFKIRVKGNWSGRYVRECFFWGKFSLAHSPGVQRCPGICMLQQCVSPCGSLLFLLCSSSTKYPLQAPDTILKHDYFPLPRPSGFQADQSSHHTGPEEPWTQLIKAVDEIKLSPSSMAD